MVMTLTLCLHVVSQAPQHFRSSEMQATHGDGCISHQSSAQLLPLSQIVSSVVLVTTVNWLIILSVLGEMQNTMTMF